MAVKYKSVHFEGSGSLIYLRHVPTSWYRGIHACKCQWLSTWRILFGYVPGWCTRKRMARTITQDSCVLNVLFTLFFLFAVDLFWGSMFSLSGSMHPVVGFCPRIFVQGKEKAPAVGWTQFWGMGRRDFHYQGKFWYGSSCLFQHQSRLAKIWSNILCYDVILQMVLKVDKLKNFWRIERLNMDLGGGLMCIWLL